MSEHSNNLIIPKLALLQAFYALYWPVKAKKNCFVRFIFQIVVLDHTIFYSEPEPVIYKPVLKYFLLERTQTEAFQFI